MEKYEKVLALMRAKGGRIELTDPELLAILDRDAKGKKNLVYRISAYMWSIRHIGNQPVRGIRSNRKVVAYELFDAPPEQLVTDDITPVVTPEPDASSDGTVVETPADTGWIVG